ncbi:MAG: endonuclease domain-containing protein [Nostoc sp. LLA-1]|nr:endonuclease domain-containing protein [Cyanocohniella sp. LLY]
MNNLTPPHTSPPTQDNTHNIVIGQKINSDKMQRAKELRRQMTPAEKILWQHLRNNRLNNLHFRRQQIIDGFIVDFYCHSAKLVIEVDGKIHEQQAEYDAERDKVLIARGLRLLRIKNEAVQQELDQVLVLISQVCCEET